jgi:hypothetical protein
MLKCSISWISRNGLRTGLSSTRANLAQSGTSNFGTTYYHSFSTVIDSGQGISSFTINVKDGSKSIEYVNGGGGYPIQDTVVWMPADSSITSTGVSLSAAVGVSPPNNLRSLIFSSHVS